MIEESKNCCCGTPEPSPYKISFDASNDLVVYDAHGEPIKGEAATFPIESTKVLAVKNITVIEAEGSHYILVCNGRTCTKYMLPH